MKSKPPKKKKVTSIQARSQKAITEIQDESLRGIRPKLTLKEIYREIDATRQELAKKGRSSWPTSKKPTAAPRGSLAESF